MSLNLRGPRVTPAALRTEIKSQENYLAVVSYLGSASKNSIKKRQQYIEDLKSELHQITTIGGKQSEYIRTR